MPKNNQRELNRKIAESTLSILEKGCYTNKVGEIVQLKDDVQYAIDNTILYRPNQFSKVLSLRCTESNSNNDNDNDNDNDNVNDNDNKTEEEEGEDENSNNSDKAEISKESNDNNDDTTCSELEITITDERTLQAAQRLINEGENEEEVLLLNFASAKNPGGGFIRGSLAQEESIARSSALYLCIEPQQEMYTQNKSSSIDRILVSSCLYKHYMIYSPKVPVFKNDATGKLLKKPYKVGMISAPAPNAGVATNRIKNADAVIQGLLVQRIDRILAVARYHNAKVLVLGAFGCGVFRNSPHNVAGIFNALLKSKYNKSFRKCIFAIPGGGPNASSFKNVFDNDMRADLSAIKAAMPHQIEESSGKANNKKQQSFKKNNSRSRGKRRR